MYGPWVTGPVSVAKAPTPNIDGTTLVAFRHKSTWYTPVLFTWKLPPEVTETIDDTPLIVQPFDDVMASRNVFDVTGDESVVVDEQFIKRPDIIPTGPVGPVEPVEPVGPVAPAPVGPVAPVPPVAPVGPVTPVGPVAPAPDRKSTV